MRYLILILLLCIKSANADTLVIGDSISLGWTAQLTDPTISHTGSGCQLQPFQIVSDLRNDEGSAHDYVCMEYWMGRCHNCTTVVFNAGIWDAATTCNTAMPTTFPQYLSNLAYMVAEIEKYGYVPVFVTTTPVPPINGSCVLPDTVIKYNQGAVDLMGILGVRVIDLYSYMLTYQAQYQLTNNVHWTTDGYSIMASYMQAQINE